MQFTHTDLDAFRTAAQPVLDAAAEEFGADLIEGIAAAQNDC